MAMTEEEKRLRKVYGQEARRKYLGKSCELCGKSSDLQAHHQNKDWKDNSPENIKTLCRKCHMSQHIGERLPCRICGQDYIPGMSRKDLCNVHRIRLQRHGTFEKTKEKKKRPCPICNRPDFLIKGLCNAHYLRLRKWGDPHCGGPLKMQYSHLGNTNKKKLNTR